MKRSHFRAFPSTFPARRSSQKRIGTAHSCPLSRCSAFFWAMALSPTKRAFPFSLFPHHVYHVRAHWCLVCVYLSSSLFLLFAHDPKPGFTRAFYPHRPFTFPLQFSSRDAVRTRRPGFQVQRCTIPPESQALSEGTSPAAVNNPLTHAHTHLLFPSYVPHSLNPSTQAVQSRPLSPTCPL